MENSPFFTSIVIGVVVTSLIVVIALLRITALKNYIKILKHQRVCELLMLDGYKQPVTFKHLPDLWRDYSVNGRYDRYSFKEHVKKMFILEILSKPDIETAVEFLLTFPEVLRLKNLKTENRRMIEEIYEHVSSGTKNKLLLLARKRYNSIYYQKKSEKKTQAMIAFGYLLDHDCIKNYFPLSKSLFDVKAKTLWQNAFKQKHKTKTSSNNLFVAVGNSKTDIEKTEPGSAQLG